MLKLKDLDLDYIMEMYKTCKYKDEIKYYVHELNTTTNKLGFFTDKFYVGVHNKHTHIKIDEIIVEYKKRLTDNAIIN